MPYISIKAYPKDEKIKQELADKINDVLLEVWGCSQEAVTISIEEIAPDKWKEQVVDKEIEPNKDKMMIISGKKTY